MKAASYPGCIPRGVTRWSGSKLGQHPQVTCFKLCLCELRIHLVSLVTVHARCWGGGSPWSAR